MARYIKHVTMGVYLYVYLHSYSLHSAALKLHRLLPISFCKYYAKYPIKVSRGAVVESVERLLKVPVRCNSTDVGSNHANAYGGRKILEAPSVEDIRALFGNKL